MILAELTDRNVLMQHLQLGGLRESVISEKAVLLMQNANVLIQSGLDKQIEAMAYLVPGRIEVLGKHTDYAGGRSIVAAVERGFCAVATARNDNLMRIWNSPKNNYIEFEMNSYLKIERGNWRNYPQTVVRRIVHNFSGPLQGADMAFSSDLPIASGMSSSSAMIVMFFLILSDINHLEKQKVYRENIRNKLDLAAYLAAIENGQSFGTLKGKNGVGTFGGSEDHTAILCSQPGHVGQFSYCPTQIERYIATPEEYVFVIGSSGVVARKTGSAMEKYNRMSRMVQAILEVWNRETNRDEKSLSALLANDPDAIGKLQYILDGTRINSFTPSELKKRLEHFICENEEIVRSAGDAMVNGKLSTFGKIVDRSQEISDTLLDNQTPETRYLARSAQKRGAVAASSFGAGFGGSVWALIKEENASSFLNKWSASYKKAFSSRTGDASFFLTNAGPAAFAIS